MNRLLLYGDLAPWFHLLTAPAEYADEAATIAAAVREFATQPVHTMLELGSGGGNNASHLTATFRMTLVDRSPEMLSVSKALNPECEHVEGDMRTVRLGRTFDAVLVHDAVTYLTTEADLLACMHAAFAHLEPGGVALFIPDYVAENYEPRTESGGHDGTDGRAMRYLQWALPLEGTTYRMLFAYVLKEPDGTVRVEHEVHTGAAFPRPTWLRLLGEAGFAPDRRVENHWANPAAERDFFIGTKPAD